MALESKDEGKEGDKSKNDGSVSLGGGSVAVTSEEAQTKEILFVDTSSSTVGRAETELDEVVRERSRRSGLSSVSVSTDPSDVDLDVTLISSQIGAVSRLNSALVRDANVRLASDRITTRVTALTALATTFDPCKSSYYSSVHFNDELIGTDSVYRG